MQQTQLTRIQEQIYSLYHGDTTRAIVRDGVCVRSIEVGQTGATWVSNNTGRDPWQGATVDALKAAGFSYRFNNTYFVDQNGAEYYLDAEGNYRTDDPDAAVDELPADQVTLI